MTSTPLHHLVYGLLYPAFLGSFIVSIWQASPGFRWDMEGDPPWAAFFATYFALQYAQSMAETSKARRRIIADILEIVAMVFVFLGLGYGSSPSEVDASADALPVLAMSAALAIPVASRLFKWLWSGEEWLLTSLSVGAISIVLAISYLGLDDVIGFTINCAILMYYAAYFVLSKSLCKQG